MIDLLVKRTLSKEKEAILENRFLSLCQALGVPFVQAQEYYQQLYDLYHEEHRHYHNLVHISNFLNLLDQYKAQIEAPLLFEVAIWYHDAIYTVKAKDNERQSANLAQELFEIYLDVPSLEYVKELILSTEGHYPRIEKMDTYFFLDFDLSILAASTLTYKLYSEAIWQEYKTAYVKLLYKMGRKKVLKNFLAREKIYFSSVFFEKYEEMARKNLKLELNGK
ncbi:hypothetical protein [Aureispira sp. CCB-QB1]|uniref:HD domain-containing protein n=1 Tax=Aureispira sp. CCB-QB1 TaxID=1313421 RepID=UPI000698559D|nr:hypothetical protein [Aureispira sp. CCB-QB1]